jgi:hypothetical protein
LSLGIAAFQAPPPGPTPASLAATKIEKVKDNLYVVTGSSAEDQSKFAGGNTAVFITESGVVVVDTKLPGWGQVVLDRIKTVTNKPITTIINTHSHGDHTGNNEFFGASVEIIAQENTLKRLSTTACSQLLMGVKDAVRMRVVSTMAASMSREEGQPRAAEPAHDDLVGRVAERRMDANTIDVGQAGQLVQATATDHTEEGFAHACRRSGSATVRKWRGNANQVAVITRGWERRVRPGRHAAASTGARLVCRLLCVGKEPVQLLGAGLDAVHGLVGKEGLGLCRPAVVLENAEPGIFCVQKKVVPDQRFSHFVFQGHGDVSEHTQRHARA